MALGLEITPESDLSATGRPGVSEVVGELLADRPARQMILPGLEDSGRLGNENGIVLSRSVCFVPRNTWQSREIDISAGSKASDPAVMLVPHLRVVVRSLSWSRKFQ